MDENSCNPSVFSICTNFWSTGFTNTCSNQILSCLSPLVSVKSVHWEYWWLNCESQGHIIRTEQLFAYYAWDSSSYVAVCNCFRRWLALNTTQSFLRRTRLMPQQQHERVRQFCKIVLISSPSGRLRPQFDRLLQIAASMFSPPPSVSRFFQMRSIVFPKHRVFLRVMWKYPLVISCSSLYWVNQKNNQSFFVTQFFVRLLAPLWVG